MSKERLADKVNIENILYDRTTKSKTERAIVTLAVSTSTLNFNTKMVTILNMKEWKNVLVGIEPDSGIIVLKECDIEEYGSVAVRTTKAQKGKTEEQTNRYLDRANKSRQIGIAHLMRSAKLKKGKTFRAEREGVMIFLEAINGNE